MMKIITLYPVEKFIDSTTPHNRSRIIKMVDILKNYPHKYIYPYIKKINSTIFELCIKGKPQIRILFAYSEESIILLNIFIKKTRKLPSKELELAIKRYLDYR